MELTFVTGGSSGIGAAVHARAEQEGGITATISRNPDRGRFRYSVDLADPGTWEDTVRWIDSIIADSEPERVTFFHCAATLDPIGFAGEVDLGAYSENVVLNSASPQVLGAGFVESMIGRSAAGALVHISSGAATTAYPGWSSYCAAKAAVEHWTRTVGKELSERGRDIKVMAIAPGVVDTPMQDRIRTVDPEHLPNVGRFHELKRNDELRDPDLVAAKLWRLARDPDVENGAILDIRDLDD